MGKESRIDKCLIALGEVNLALKVLDILREKTCLDLKIRQELLEVLKQATSCTCETEDAL